jgi:hypothetical protein
MDTPQQLLFGGFPRAVGVTTPDIPDMELRQFIVHSEEELDGVIDRVSGERNVYASLSVYDPVKVDGTFKGSAVKSDKVSFDFDSSAKAEPEADPYWSHPLIPDFASDYEVIEMMREDEEVRDAVLGDVCFNVRELVKACRLEDIPVMGVFSGFGVHVHQLREPTRSRPGDKMLSTCNKWVSDLSLSCADEAASGRPFRIMRLPNTERIAHIDSHAEGEPGSGTDNRRTGIYQVPLTAAEMAEIEPKDLMDLSQSPRPKIGSEPQSRPQMKVQTDYLGPQYDEGVGQEKMRPVPDKSMADDMAELLIKKLVQMPCVYERALGRNPPNDVRVKVGIMLLNSGKTVGEATELISRLNWVDFDRETTKYQLKQLKKTGKGDWSCKTMRAKGLCTRADDVQDCPTYGYQGGNSPGGSL